MTVDQQREYAKSIYQSQGGEHRVGTPLLLFAVWFEYPVFIKYQCSDGRGRQESDRLTRNHTLGPTVKEKIGSREKLVLSFASMRIVPRVLAMVHTNSTLNLTWGLRCRFSASR